MVSSRDGDTAPYWWEYVRTDPNRDRVSSPEICGDPDARTNSDQKSNADGGAHLDPDPDRGFRAEIEAAKEVLSEVVAFIEAAAGENATLVDVNVRTEFTTDRFDDPL